MLPLKEMDKKRHKFIKVTKNTQKIIKVTFSYRLGLKKYTKNYVKV